MTAPETPLPSPPGMKITQENKLKGSLFIEAYGSLIDSIGGEAESETDRALGITFNAIGAASSTVMLAIDPLGSLIGAGIGWLIEHVSFLRDALNQLMGNPEEIQANVEANKARAAELRVLAEDHKSGLATFDGWTGSASEAYKKSMDGMSQELDELAQAVETKAKIVAIMGMLVTVLRDIVRDLIAQLLGSLIGGALIAVATMIPTFGASIPAFIGFAVGKAVALGVNIASRVARVVAALTRQMKRIGDLDGIMAKISKGWERFENSADVAEISYEGYKASKGVDKKINEAVAKNNSGGGGTGGAATASAPDVLASARVGTVGQDGTAATPMNIVSRTQVDAAEPMQALKRTDVAEPVQPLQRTQMDTVQPLQRMEAVQAPMAPANMDVASDSTVASGVSMTSNAPVQHEAVQAREMYSGVEATPAEPVQSVAAFEPVARTQAFEAREPAREDYNPLQARTAYSGFEAPAAPMQSASAWDTTAQSDGAPLRRTSVERPAER